MSSSRSSHYLATIGLAVSAVGLAVNASAQQAETTVAIRFAATVGDEPAACGRSYAGIGTSRSALSLVDLRLYVSRLRLVRPDGSEQPVALKQDGLWQVDDVALLDFEDGTGACANGTAPTRDVVEGRVPPGAYVGLRFDLGLPFEKNHRESTLQPSPLNLTRLFWNWNAGYKFLRLDLRTTGQPKGWMVHLGSTGCTPGGTPSTVPTSCTHRNVPGIDLARFDAATDVVAFDVKALLAASDVDMNQAETAVGCMSGQTDLECGPIFGALGLAWGDRAAPAQTAFVVRHQATARSER